MSATWKGHERRTASALEQRLAMLQNGVSTTVDLTATWPPELAPFKLRLLALMSRMARHVGGREPEARESQMLFFEHLHAGGDLMLQVAALPADRLNPKHWSTLRMDLVKAVLQADDDQLFAAWQRLRELPGFAELYGYGPEPGDEQYVNR